MWNLPSNVLTGPAGHVNSVGFSPDGKILAAGSADEDVEERAWHLALGADRPSEEIGGMLDTAAKHAASRGAPEAAAALEEQAARLLQSGQGRWRTVAEVLAAAAGRP